MFLLTIASGEAISQPAPSAPLPFAADLDGGYVWLGVTGAATRDDGAWDSVFGMELAVMRVREAATVGVLGVGLAGSRLAMTEKWRLTLEGLVGTRLAGRATVGLALGPTLDLSRTTHAVAGASAAVWVFLGITPYVRVGVLSDGTQYVDLGAQLALPIARF